MQSYLKFAEDMRTKKEILNHIVYVGKQNLPHGGRLILYGSQARGTATDASDWDLLIILDKPFLLRQKEMQGLFFGMSWQIDYFALSEIPLYDAYCVHF